MKPPNHVLDADWGYAGAPPQSGQHFVIQLGPGHSVTY